MTSPRVRRWIWRAGGIGSAFAGAAFASLVVAEATAAVVRLDSLEVFRSSGADWSVAGGIAGDPRRERQLVAQPGTGVLLCNPSQSKERRGNLLTIREHGDVDLRVEFLLPPGSNSGLYLQGRYEVQLMDSWGVREPRHGDCGGIYQRWDPARGKGREGFEGHAPRVNACREPGVWQQLRIIFHAPRFDASGQKTRHARFARVELNGIVIHENVEVFGPTRAAAFDAESPLGPLMIQGDHGAVALKNLTILPLGAERVDGPNPRAPGDRLNPQPTASPSQTGSVRR